MDTKTFSTPNQARYTYNRTPFRGQTIGAGKTRCRITAVNPSQVFWESDAGDKGACMPFVWNEALAIFRALKLNVLVENVRHPIEYEKFSVKFRGRK